MRGHRQAPGAEEEDTASLRQREEGEEGGRGRSYVDSRRRGRGHVASTSRLPGPPQPVEQMRKPRPREAGNGVPTPRTQTHRTHKHL